MEQSPSPRSYRVGTLRYTLPRLLLVSVMMLLATQAMSLVCYNLVPSVKPILLDRVGASSTEIALIISTIPQALNFVLCPLISTISDKTRSRIGRRMPFLIGSAPVLVLLLVLIAWSGDLAALLVEIFPALRSVNVAFWLLATLILLFQVVYLFPGSVIYYLIADVIPRECLGRYMAIATIAGSGLSAGFNFFILKYAVDSMKTTFCILGALYLAIYILLLCFVPEGKYPPVEDTISVSGNFLVRAKAYVAMFFRECFSRRIFVLLFFCTGLNQASNICRSMYNILFATKDIGLSISGYGRIIGIGAVISAVVIFFMGKIMDRTHPMFIYLIGGIFILLVNVFGYFFVYTPMTFAVIGIATAIMYAIQGLAYSPLLINLLPPDKFGQFSSANSMVNAVAVLFGSWLGGILTDCFGYRVMFLWDFCITLLATFALLGVYKQWKLLGGREHYTPPAVDVAPDSSGAN
ncbi:MFS transporter [Victivallis sp.]|uniref:MFS transporter n=1 Tax=Victivallis sp. TaxID=2049020 RepID=UPI003A952074